MKFCKGCGEWKHPEDFYTRAALCKECQKEQSRKNYLKRMKKSGIRTTGKNADDVIRGRREAQGRGTRAGFEKYMLKNPHYFRQLSNMPATRENVNRYWREATK